MQLPDSEFLCQFQTCIVVFRVIFRHCGRHAVVPYNCNPVRIVDGLCPHPLECIHQIRRINIVDHKHIRSGNHDIARFNMFLARVLFEQLLRQGIARFSALFYGQRSHRQLLYAFRKALFRILDQASV